jgi:hypothetical protein
MPAELLDVLEGDPANFKRMCAGVTNVIERSFQRDRLMLIRPIVNDTERRRRLAMCEDIIRTLRGDLKWSLTRILDHLPDYLRAELDGESWEPSARASWTTSG